MTPWIKICGNTTLGDAQIAVAAGADAVGFVFAPSPRQVTPAQVAEITLHLPPEVEKIGVFLGSDFAEIARTARAARLTGVQLHGGGSNEMMERLRTALGPALRILQVIHFGEQAVPELTAARANPNIDGVLIDSRTATAVGGTGVAYDWQSARTALFSDAHALKLIAAGGLTPGNVALAIKTMYPWGVDVVSGVEAAPGSKDAQKVADFVANARAASLRSR